MPSSFDLEYSWERQLQMILDKAPIITHYCFGNFCILELKSNMALNSQPGQFVMIRVSSSFDPFLRRPFSIFQVNGDKISIFYKIVGKGTKIMSSWEKGQIVDILGPLGKGFSICDKKSVLLVAGGMGIAPLAFLASTLLKKNCNFQVIWGVEHRMDDRLIEILSKIVKNLIIYTKDGSFGKKGLASDGLKWALEKERPDYMYACGPLAMLKAIFYIAKDEKTFLEVCLESQMACGIGACLGCVIQGRSGPFKVCQEGPVFKAENILWEI